MNNPELPLYRKRDVPLHLKTKSQWSEEGFRLRKGAQPKARRHGYHSGQTYDLYAPDDVEPKRRAREPKHLPLTPENIAAALYESNKGAKRRREAARKAYEKRQHGFAGHHRRQKDGLYSLKHAVAEKAVAEGLAVLVGYHTKQDERTQYQEEQDDLEEDLELEGEDGWDDPEREYRRPRPRREKVVVVVTRCLACYDLAGYRFHLPVDSIPADATVEIKDLGQWVSQAAPRTGKMTIREAEVTLRAYLAAGSIDHNASIHPAE